MLTPRQNLLETIRGGSPDRFVNQFEFMKVLYSSPYFDLHNGPKLVPGIVHRKDAWGVYWCWPEDAPGEFPEHDPEHLLVPDVTEWKKRVTVPDLIFPDEEWRPYQKMAESVDREKYFLATVMWPGIFERLHHFLDIPQTMISFYEEPEALKDLIGAIADWEADYAEVICGKLRPDALFHHDDWGTQISTFISPQMFEEFLLPAYRKVYGRYRELGVKLIVHHSDSYAATLVPYMIDMGIDIWQGVMRSNHVPGLIRDYGGQISFMGGIDSAAVDHEGWTREEIRAEVRKACDENGKLYYIPNATLGMDTSIYPGVYEALSEEIDLYSREVFR